jgi:uncharacterized membrane protein
VRIFRKVDDALMAVAESSSMWFQNTFGKNNFFLARLAKCGAVVCAVISLLRFICIDHGSASTVQWVDYLLVIMFLPGCFGLESNIQERSLENLSGSRFANPRKRSPIHFVLRMCFVVMAVLQVVLGVLIVCLGARSGSAYLHYWSSELIAVFILAVIYFQDCDSPPPGIGKIAEWFQSLFMRPVTAKQ